MAANILRTASTILTELEVSIAMTVPTILMELDGRLLAANN